MAAIYLSHELEDRLARLTELSGCESSADTIRQALQLYEYLIEQSIAGAMFYVKPGTTEDEVKVEIELFTRESER